MSPTSRQRGASGASEPTEEPPTRLLKTHELREHLRRAAHEEPDTSALTRPRMACKPEPETVTRWARPRVRPAEVEGEQGASEATATSLAAGELRAGMPRLGQSTAPVPPRAPASVTTAPMTPLPAAVVARPRAPRRTLLGGALAAVLLVLPVVWLRTRAAPSVARESARGLLAPAPARQPSKPVRHEMSAVAMPALPADAPRRALDLLLEGRTRDALDAYRALVQVQPSHGAFAQTVRLLEQELRSCQAGGAPCR